MNFTAYIHVLNRGSFRKISKGGGGGGKNTS